MYERSFNPFANNLKIVKDYFKSNTTLVLAITKAAAIVLSLVTSVYTILNYTAIMNDIYAIMTQSFAIMQEELGLPADLAGSALEQATSSVSIGFSIPVTAILVCIAFFIIFFKSRNEAPDSSPRAGVIILYVVAVIELVLVIIGLVTFILALVGFILLAVLGNEELSRSFISLDMGEFTIDLDPTFLLVIGICLCAVFGVVIVIAMISAVSKKNYYKSVKNSISTVELQNKGARTYGVMCVISAIGSAGSILSTIPMLLGTGVNGVRLSGSLVIFTLISALSLVVAVVGYIAEAKLAFGYAKYINEIKYGYSRPVAPAAPYAPFPSVSGYGAPQSPTQDGYNANVSADNPYADPYGSQPQTKAPTSCPSCGAPVDANAPFCGNCGTKL